MKRCVTGVLLLALTVLCIPPAASQESPPPAALALSPAAEPSPALKYALLPEYLDRLDGNAAPVYLKALLMLRDIPSDAAAAEKITHWVAAPVGELPLKEVRQVVDKHQAVYRQAQEAARHEECDWNLGERHAGKDLFGLLLPEAQEARNLGRLVALKARLEIAERKYDDALATLQTGYALARHLATQPFLVSGLVSAAITAQMADQVQALAAAPEAPNLYWAIAALPRPLIDARRALELEGHSLLIMYPELRDIERKAMTDDQWRGLWRKYSTEIGELMSLMGEAAADEPPGAPKDIAEAARRALRMAMADALLEKKHESARKALIERGYAEKDVKKMSKEQAVLLDEVLTFRIVRDDCLRWMYLPYWQAREGIARADAALAARAKKRDKAGPEEGHIVDLLLPACGRVSEAFVAVDQRLAALQTIEAVRMHAAANEGKLPRTLDEITIVPVPVNPFTGQRPDYKYSMETGAAALKFAHPRPERQLSYELRMR